MTPTNDELQAAFERSELHMALLAWKYGDLSMVDLKKLIRSLTAGCVQESKTIDELTAMLKSEGLL